MVLFKEEVKKGSYLKINIDGIGEILCYLDNVVRRSDLSKKAAAKLMNGIPVEITDMLEGFVSIIGYIKNDKFQFPAVTARSGTEVYYADEDLIRNVLKLNNAGKGYAYIGMLENQPIKVNIDINQLLNKHFSVIAKTGAGKSYFVAVILEELLKNNVTTVVIDPHDEYRTFTEESEYIPAMKEFEMVPLSFRSKINIFGIDKSINSQYNQLTFTLRRSDIDFLLSTAGLSAERYHELFNNGFSKEIPPYNLDKIMSHLRAEEDEKGKKIVENISMHKYRNLFVENGTPITSLIKEGELSVISLAGADPVIQEYAVNRICTELYEAVKAKKLPSLALIIEEAHNFVPQTGGNALSSSILKTIASEGRKFGVGLGIITQRPAKIDKNVLSQCGTQITLQVTSSIDLKVIGSSMEGYTDGLEKTIQNLEIGKALISGYAVRFPLVMRIRPRHTKHGGDAIPVIKW
jgi:DNA helicase HerA-like ATPase